jgi:hypothetical protein
MNTGKLANREDDRWQAIVTASEALLKAVQEEQWEGVELQARFRDKLIRDYFKAPLTVDNALRIQEGIKSILALDEQVLGHARREQEKTSRVLKNFNTGGKAIKSYQSNLR